MSDGVEFVVVKTLQNRKAENQPNNAFRISMHNNDIKNHLATEKEIILHQTPNVILQSDIWIQFILFFSIGIENIRPGGMRNTNFMTSCKVSQP